MMQQKNALFLGAAILGGVLVFAVHGIATSIASGRYEYEERRLYTTSSHGDAEAVLYRQECSDCHMAYPPGLLPSQSWLAVMEGLEDHFGEDASLDAQTEKQLYDFLLRASRPAGHAWSMRNQDGRFPLRITELSYFRHEHDEIPSGFLRGNDKVSSLSQCDACHRQAERGWFDEDDIHIPGIGRWDD